MKIIKQPDPVCIFIYCFYEVRINIILPFMPRSTKWPLPFKLIYYNSVYTQRPLVCLQWQARIEPSVSEQQMLLWTSVFVLTTGARKAVINKETWEYWMAGMFKQVALHVYQICTNSCRHHIISCIGCLATTVPCLWLVGITVMQRK